MEYVRIDGRKVTPVPFNLFVQLGSVVDFNINVLRHVLSKIGYNHLEEDLSERLCLAKCWIEECSTESINKIRYERNWGVFNTFTDEEKKEIRLLHSYLSNGGYTLDELQT